MISIIITAYKEEKTIGKSIQSILENNIKEDYEILVVAPDKKTLNVAKKYKKVKTIQDSGDGKPTALNLAISNSKGNILVLTDGDVYISKNAIPYLIGNFQDNKVGAVSGNPFSINNKNSMFGYWAYVLTKIANKRRILASSNKKRFFCSGYLFAIRKNLFPNLPKELLSEDGFISNKVYEKGYKIIYETNAKVFVKYPDNFQDWIMQKKRSAGGYNQIKKISKIEMRSFKKESLGGFAMLKFITSFKELIWMAKLFLARLYLWGLIYKDINIKNKSHKDIWKRIESTK